MLSEWNHSLELQEQLFPTKLREDVTWLTPLYDVKNLKIDVRFEDDPKQSIKAFGNLLKCLFWLVPLPKCITFVTSTKEQSIKVRIENGFVSSRLIDWLISSLNQPPGSCLLDCLLQFGYCEIDEGTHPCCVYYPEQCWRHRLVSVELSNFDNDHPKSIAKKKELLGFLKLNASRLKTIRDDCDELPESSSSELPESSSSELPESSSSEICWQWEHIFFFFFFGYRYHFSSLYHPTTFTIQINEDKQRCIKRKN